MGQKMMCHLPLGSHKDIFQYTVLECLDVGRRLFVPTYNLFLDTYLDNIILEILILFHEVHLILFAHVFIILLIFNFEACYIRSY